jgi:fucose permease
MLTALVGTAGVLYSGGNNFLFASVVLVGLGLAPIFPTAIAILSNSLAGQSGTKLGWMFAAAGLGGAVLPPCIGALSSFSQSLRTGMAILLVAEAALLASHFVMSRIAANVAAGAGRSALVA